MTLLDYMKFYYKFDCFKHNLAKDADIYAEDKINAMTNIELIEELSYRFEEIGITWPDQ